MTTNNELPQNILFFRKFVNEYFFERKIGSIKNYKKKFNAFVEAYYKIEEQAVKYDISDADMIYIFLVYCAGEKGGLDFAIASLKKLLENKTPAMDIHLALGTAYYIIATFREDFIYEFKKGLGVQFYYVMSTRYYRLAAKHLKRVLKKYHNDLMIYSMLTKCYFAIKHKDRHAFLNKTLVLFKSANRTKNYVSGITREGLFRIHLFIAEQYIQKELYTDAINFLRGLKREIFHAQHMFIYFVLLCFAYSNLGDYQRSLRILMAYRKIYKAKDDPRINGLIGRDFMRLHQFYRASLFFARSIKLIKQTCTFKQELEILYEFAEGMWNWKIDLLEDAKRHFGNAKELIVKNNIKKFNIVAILPDVLEIDIRISALAETNSESDFADHFICLSLDLYRVLMNLYDLCPLPNFFMKANFDKKKLYNFIVKNVAKLAKNKKVILPERNPLEIVYLLLHSKSIYLLTLTVIFSKIHMDEKALNLLKYGVGLLSKKIQNDNDLFRHLNESINNNKESLDKFGLSKLRFALDKLIAFAHKYWFMSSQEAENMLNCKWRDVIKELNPSLKTVGFESTAQTINLYLINMGTVEIIAKEEPTKKTELGSDMLTIGSKGSGIAKKKIKILTEGQKEIPEIYFGLEPNDKGIIKPIIKINNLPYRIKYLEERIFVKLFYLAAIKLSQKDGFIDIEELHLYAGKQGFQDLLDYLDEKYSRILERTQDRKIRLNLEKDKIILDKSLIHFVSEHWPKLLSRVAYLNTIKDDKENLQIEIERLLKNSNYQSAIRNTIFVREALEKINWRFQSHTWRKRWYNVLNNIKNLVNVSGLADILKISEEIKDILEIINSETKK